MDLSRILELAGIITEGVADKYGQMFSAIPVERDFIDKQIKWAIDNLKREDRIIWYLRYFRIGLLSDWLIKNKNDEQHASISQMHQKFIKQLVQKTKSNPSEVAVSANSIMSARTANALTHIMAVAEFIKPLSDMVWDAQTPKELIDQSTQLEKEYNDTKDANSVPKTEDKQGATKLIDFGNGYAWWNLGQSCDREEGQAMGHCGNNQGRMREDDEVLSLRKRVVRYNKEVDIPCLTFILNNGELGEMKGRGNDKPAKQYHKYIIQLLLSKYVDTIKGGGYAPQSNFKLTDLTEDEQEYVLSKKPDIIAEKTFYEKVEAIRDYGVYGDFEQDGDDIIVWSGRQRDLPDSDIVDKALSYIDEIDKIKDYINEKGMKDIISYLSEDDIEILMKLCHCADVDYLPRMMRNTDLIYDFFTKNAPYSTKEILEFLKENIHYFYNVKIAENVYPYLAVPDDIVDGKYKVKISMSEFEGLYEDTEGDDDYSDILYFRDGWFDDYRYEESEIKERISDPDLYDFLNKKNFGDTTIEIMADKLKKALEDGSIHSRPDMEDLFNT